MSKSKEELEVLKKEVEELNEKIRELTPEELEQVCGGANPSLMGPAAVAAYSYMALVPVIQPPV